MNTIGFGGSCHWCTEAIFQSLKGVAEVQQGWIASEGDAAEFSEAVIVKFDAAVISLKTLVAVHLYTHSCTADHSLRGKYRSAVYVTDESDVSGILSGLQREFDKPLITRVLPLRTFRWNKPEFLNYYYTNPERPFCKTYINPKLQLIFRKFGKDVIASPMDPPHEISINKKNRANP